MNWADLASLVTILLGSIGIQIYLFSGFEKRVDAKLNDFALKLDCLTDRLERSEEKFEKRMDSETRRIDGLYENFLKHLNK